MAGKKGGLGRGFEALFADNATEDTSSGVTLPVGELSPNREQPRKNFRMHNPQPCEARLLRHGDCHTQG